MSRASRPCSARAIRKPASIRAAPCSADLARHPATAQHIAQKLAAHFVADEPPPTLVAKLAKSFNDSDGNLKEVAKTLITADESWTPQRQKLKSPAEWIAACFG